MIFRSTKKDREGPGSVGFYKRLGFEPIDEDEWNEGYAAFRYGCFVLQLMNFISEKVLVDLAVDGRKMLGETWERLAERGIPIRAEAHGAQWEDPEGNSFYLFAKEPGRLREALGD